MRITRAQIIAEEDTHYANVADNDMCVAEAVTGLFWQGTFEDNAMGLSALVPVALITFFFTFLM